MPTPRFDPGETPPECRDVILFASPNPWEEDQAYSECMLCRARFGHLEPFKRKEMLHTCPRCKTTAGEYWTMMKEKGVCQRS